jgi:hypothetical protein
MCTDKATKQWRELHKGELHILYFSSHVKEKYRYRECENRVLRGIFGPKRDGVPGGSRKLNNEELHNLYCSENNIRVIKSRRMRSAGHVARMGEMRNATQFLLGSLKGRYLSEDLGVDVRIILKWILRKSVWGYRLDSSGSG